MQIDYLPPIKSPLSSPISEPQKPNFNNKKVNSPDVNALEKKLKEKDFFVDIKVAQPPAPPTPPVVQPPNDNVYQPPIGLSNESPVSKNDEFLNNININNIPVNKPKINNDIFNELPTNNNNDKIELHKDVDESKNIYPVRFKSK